MAFLCKPKKRNRITIKSTKKIPLVFLNSKWNEKIFFYGPQRLLSCSTIIECSIAKVLNFNLPNDMNDFTFAYFRLENGIWDTVMKLIFQTREGSIHFLDSIVMLQIIIQGETIYHIKMVLNLLYFYLVTKPLSIFLLLL